MRTRTGGCSSGAAEGMDVRGRRSEVGTVVPIVSILTRAASSLPCSTLARLGSPVTGVDMVQCDVCYRPPREARVTLILLGILALAGFIVGWGKGNLPQRAPRDVTAATKGTTPDLALYQAVIADVRSGRDYYDAAHERIPQFGFPIRSPLNWRLPTYAWLLAVLPNKCWI